MHLVLPPAPSPSTPANAPAPIQEESARNPINTVPQNPLLAANRSAIPSIPQAAGMRFRGTVPATTGSSEMDLRLALQRNFEAFRRQAELQERGGSHTPPTSQSTATATSSDPFASHVSSLLPQQAEWQRLSEGFSNPSISATPNHTPSTTTTATTSLPFNMPSTTSTTTRSSVTDSEISDFSDNQQFRLQVLRHHIALGEDQLSRGIAPPFDHIIRMRTQLFQLLDDQYRNPLARRDGSVESLLTRVFNMYTRADQLRVLHTRTLANLQTNLAGTVANAGSTTPPFYLLSSPNGYQGVVASSNAAGTAQASLAALRAAQPPGPTPTVPGVPGVPGADNPPNVHHIQPNPAAMENAVRQAVLNQRLHNNDNQLGLARMVRRMWLFVRLYFFCYMFSEPGTWTRIFFVCLAVIVSLLSDTGIPQQLHGMIIAPVQRHMEGVIERPQRSRTATANQQQQSAANPTPEHRADSQPEAEPTGIRHMVRRAERSILFFMASLIPGISEHYIAMTNEVDSQNAQRAREAEEEEANRHRQEEADRAERAAASDQHARDAANPHAHPDQVPAPANEAYYDTSEQG